MYKRIENLIDEETRRYYPTHWEKGIGREIGKYTNLFAPDFYEGMINIYFGFFQPTRNRSPYIKIIVPLELIDWIDESILVNLRLIQANVNIEFHNFETEAPVEYQNIIFHMADYITEFYKLEVLHDYKDIHNYFHWHRDEIMSLTSEYEQ